MAVDEEIVTLLVIEAVTNAVVHGHEPVTLCIELGDGVVLVTVTDCAPEALPELQQPSDDERGRGVLLINGLADRWGIDVAAGAKTVWFEMRISDGR